MNVSSSGGGSRSDVVDKNTPHFVILEVGMPYSKAEFDADKQTKYKKAMARVALTIPENIVIGITEARRRANNTTFSLLAVKHVSTGVNTDDVNQERSFEAHISNIAKKAPRGESTPANDHLRSTCAVYTDSSCPSGDRVKRGPDWEWGNQDGGDGLGTVQSRDGAGWCDVEWDNGNSNSYRVGYNGAYDLCRLAPGSTGSAGCDKSAFETCADLGNHNYVQECCQGSCAYGYDDCYFCPASGTGGPHCFKLAASKETACLASSNCAAAAASPSPSPSPAATPGVQCQ
jgi:hypothetical protein